MTQSRRPLLTREDVKRMAEEEERAVPSDAELDAALGRIDQQAIEDEERARWTIEIWDRKSPINGVPAETFFERHVVPEDGDVYVMRRDDGCTVFQPHEPHVSGFVPIPKGKGQERAEQERNRMAASWARQRVYQAALGVQ